jgi:hypothetical protein
VSTREPRRGLPLPVAIGLVIVILTLCCAVGFFAFWAIQGGTPKTLGPSAPPSSAAVSQASAAAPEAGATALRAGTAAPGAFR